jgi:hypothetical protein
LLKKSLMMTRLDRKTKHFVKQVMSFDVVLACIIPWYGVATWTLRKVNWKYQESFEKWCWRRTDKITWADRVRNKEMLHRVKKKRNFLHTIKISKANWIDHILRMNCLYKTSKTRYWRKDRGKNRGNGKRINKVWATTGYLKKIERKIIYRILWRTGFGRFYGPVVKADCGMNMKTVVMDRISYCIASLITNFCKWRTVWAPCGFTASSLFVINIVAQHTTGNKSVRHVLTRSVYVIFRFVMSTFGSSWNPGRPHTVPSAGRHW